MEQPFLKACYYTFPKLYNYNCDSNEEMLRADGYLPEDDIQILTPENNDDIDI